MQTRQHGIRFQVPCHRRRTSRNLDQPASLPRLPPTSLFTLPHSSPCLLHTTLQYWARITPFATPLH